MEAKIKIGDKVTSNSNCTTLKAGEEAIIHDIYREEDTGEIWFGLTGKNGKLPGLLSIENTILIG